MRKMTIAGSAVVALAIALTGCAPASDTGESKPASQASQEAPSAAAVELSGDFGGLNDKKVEGSVKIDGNTITLTGFSSDEGPDLHLYLANGTDEAAVSAGVLIDAVAFDEDSQVFTLDGDIDAADYTDLVVHCDKAKAVFGAAPLA